MKKRIITSQEFGSVLYKAGIIPENCRKIVIVAGAR